MGSTLGFLSMEERMIKRIFCLILSCLVAILCVGCQDTPEHSVVSSKNDGVFEEALNNTPTPIIDIAVVEQEETNEEGTIQYENNFTNQDGSITYQIQFTDLQLQDYPTPVLQVRPSKITSDQARNIAQALFGDTEMFEYTEKLSKTEIEEAILSLRERISDQSVLLEYCGGDEQMADYMTLYCQSKIEQYEKEYLSADDTKSMQLCDWEFHPQSYYFDSIPDMGVNTYPDDNADYIVAMTEKDSVPYVFRVCNKDSGDYYIHSIFAYLNETKVNNDDIYATALPDETEIEEANLQAYDILSRMGFDNWIIDSCEVEEQPLLSGRTGYRVAVCASPVYEGVPVVRQPQIMNLKSEDEFASNYYYEDVVFYFTQGNLVYFEYQSPLDVVDIVNSNVAVIPFDNILKEFEEYLKLDEISSYAFPHLQSVEVCVNDVEFGLTRTRIKDNHTDYYLVPAYTFRGTYELYDTNGALIMVAPNTFAVINAVDGSIINTQLGY